MNQQMMSFKVGDTVKVSQKVKEGKRERTVFFKGKVVDIKGKDENKMFTVKQVIDGVDVERIFPLNSPVIDSISVEEKPKKKVRRANLSRFDVK